MSEVKHHMASGIAVTPVLCAGFPLVFSLLLFIAPAAHTDSEPGTPQSYTSVTFAAPLDWQYVSTLTPAYSEAVYSLSPGAAYRYYPDDSVGLTFDLSYLYPWARVVSSDGTDATTVRDDHSSWFGIRTGAAATWRWYLSGESGDSLPIAFHMDAGAHLTYYNREAENIFGERAFRSTRIGLSATAGPGLLFEVHDSFFLGVDVSLGASLVNRETVNRRYLEDLAYNSFFRGVTVAPGITTGVSF